MKLCQIILLLFIFFGTASLNAQLAIGTTPIDTITLVTGLDTPWEILWGPDNRIWMTERYGRVSTVDPETGDQKELITIPDVHEQSESGLLGMTLHPDFATNGYVYLVYNYQEAGKILEKLVRYTHSDGTLTAPQTLLDNISGAGNHNGSRLAFDTDKKLYMTTGDAGNTLNSQDTSSLSGKILRMNPDGTVPDDNPITGSYIWTLGHRNPQGLVFSDAGLLYSSEHGPSNDDEVNLIEEIRNYGWPDVHGFCNDPTEILFCDKADVMEPLAAWTPTLAVAGLDYYKNTRIPGWDHSLLMVSLKAGRLTSLNLSQDGESVENEADYFTGWWGRLRDICISPDGRVFIATSNRDGRGNVKPGDDRIVEIRPVIEAGINTNHIKQLLIYPNPVSGDLLKLKNLPDGDTRIRIMDISGRVLFEQSYSGKNLHPEIPFKWNTGIYVLQAENRNECINFPVIK